ncbi:MAG: MAPEG family protein [Rhodobiaceae bacterium]|nr:MAPEG family protein [Rhodobiaceae bacterium]
MWSGVLLLVLILASAGATDRVMGFAWGVSNRDVTPTLEGWSARLSRTYKNHLENTVIFAAIVLPVSAAGISTEMTMLGAQVFLGARLVHAVAYITGITFLGIRSAAYFVGVAGTVMVLIPAL